MQKYKTLSNERRIRKSCVSRAQSTGGKVRANSYNPNHVAAPEMKLLELSIWEDGYTMPCVCYYIPDEDIYELVDGYHRYCVLKTSKRVFEREKVYFPWSL